MSKEHEKLQKYWKCTRKIIKPILTRLYGYTFKDAPKIEGNYLVVCNHNSNLDPWILSLSFEQQMYFLAGENVFRLGFLSWLVKTFWAPISKLKGKSDVTAMMQLIRHLKDGHNASLFPEGNRSFNGETNEILPAIGKLAKVSGAGLVTFKIEGLYFATPRWGNLIRKGKTQGAVVNVYSAETLKSMSVEEVHKAIIEDLHENAYETQSKNPVKFKNRKRAECIESALYICPNCKAIGSLRSKKHHFHCVECNAKAEFTEYGYIEGDFGFKTVLDWDKWQEKELLAKIDIAIEQKSTEPILWDDDLELKVIDIDHNEKTIAAGRFELYLDKITVGNKEIFYSELVDMAMTYRRTLVFSTKQNENYQIFSKTFRCARHYLLAQKYIRKQLGLC